jgi:outer membrane protein assembly factor BamD (BamD/ComL family)
MERMIRPTMERMIRLRPALRPALPSLAAALVILVGGLAAADPAPPGEVEALKRTLRVILGDSAKAGAATVPAPGVRPPGMVPDGARPRARILPRPEVGRHSLEVDIEAARADTVFAAFRGDLRAGRLDAAREDLRRVAARARQPVEREIAEFDTIELDFFQAAFDTAASSYRAFAATHPRGYLTNDAIGRMFLIDENSDCGRKPLTLYGASEMQRRAGRPDSAAALLRQVLDRHPGVELQDDCLLALGDLALRSPSPAVALGYYRAVADSMPDSPLAAAALMRIGRCQTETKQDVPAAIAADERVLDRFPDSVEADEARKLIERLRKQT